MKQHTLLRLLIVLCIAVSGIILTATRLHNAAGWSAVSSGSLPLNRETAPAEAMIWQSLYQHLLMFN